MSAMNAACMVIDNFRLVMRIVIIVCLSYYNSTRQCCDVSVEDSQEIPFFGEVYKVWE